MVRRARVWPTVGVGYRHYKTGTVYFVEAVGSFEPDPERILVAYRSREEIAMHAPSWFRTLPEFTKPIPKARGGTSFVERFTRTNEVLPESERAPFALIELARRIVDELPALRTAMPSEMVRNVKAFAALLAVDHGRGNATVGYIHRATGLSQATTSETLIDLKKAGLVSPFSSASIAAREFPLSLTPKGLRARRQTRKRKREAGGGNGSEEGEALGEEEEGHQEEGDQAST